jgi:hypothetical protein
MSFQLKVGHRIERAICKELKGAILQTSTNSSTNGREKPGCHPYISNMPAIFANDVAFEPANELLNP